MIKYFVIKHFRGTCSSAEILKGYMLICRNAEVVHGKRKVEKQCFSVSTLRDLKILELFNYKTVGTNCSLFPCLVEHGIPSCCCRCWHDHAGMKIQLLGYFASLENPLLPDLIENVLLHLQAIYCCWSGCNAPSPDPELKDWWKTHLDKISINISGLIRCWGKGLSPNNPCPGSGP